MQMARIGTTSSRSARDGTGAIREFGTSTGHGGDSLIVTFSLALNELNGITRALLPTKSESEQVRAAKEMRNPRLNPAMLDIFFAGKPLVCEATCRLLETIFTWKKTQGLAEAGNYKYILDVGVWLLL